MGSDWQKRSGDLRSIWLLPEYSSTTKEVKSGATSYPACLTYIPRWNNKKVHVRAPSTESQQRTRRESSKSGDVVQLARDRWSHVTATWTNHK